MIRRTLVLMAGVSLMLLLWAGPAGAQASPPSVLESSTVQVQVEGEALVRTGTDVMPIVYTGVGLAVVGVALAVAARRRQNAHAPLH